MLDFAHTDFFKILAANFADGTNAVQPFAGEGREALLPMVGVIPDDEKQFARNAGYCDCPFRGTMV